MLLPYSQSAASLRLTIVHHATGAAVSVAERLDCSPPITANRVQSPAGSFRIFASGNRAGRCYRSAGFLGDLPFPPALSVSRLMLSDCWRQSNSLLVLPGNATCGSMPAVEPVLQVDPGFADHVEQCQNAKAWGNGSSLRKLADQRHRPAPCEYPGVTRPGIEPGSSWWEASSLTVQPLQPLQSVATRRASISQSLEGSNDRRKHCTSELELTLVVVCAVRPVNNILQCSMILTLTIHLKEVEQVPQIRLVTRKTPDYWAVVHCSVQPRASQNQSNDTHTAPYDRVKRRRERKIIIKES
ncbi:hypothetical protein PR048_002582 [Dryococelus australis]|uniref:Uncharacterized protein n=1 Tax=Dryococelus australis TaxID=614101 RepID=A0ABQ9IKP8_9NEOP|nr:hypothetical protein PR048_002582 [Dryococelus australis]